MARAPRTHCDFAVALHDTNLDVLRACLDNLEQTLDCQLDGVVAAKVILVVLLEEFTNGFGGPTNCVGLSAVVNVCM